MDLTELQTAPPALRSGLVMRYHLVASMLSSEASRTIVVTAPAGYGKTTLLVQLAGARLEPTAWLTLGRADNDVTTFVSHAATAFVRGGLLTGAAAKRVRAGGVASLAGAVRGGTAGTSAPAVFILDQAEVLTRGAVLDVLAELIERLQGRVQFIVASRSTPRLSLTSLRAAGRVLEITETDLALNEGEAGELLAHLGVSTEEAQRIIGICEGWPVALYLIALALRQGRGKWSIDEVGGASRIMVDYLAEQVIRTLPRSHYELLVRTSILNQLSGSVCDAVLKSKGSERMLRSIEASTHLVQVVDPAGEWFTINGVLRAALAAELERVWPESVASMHERAAAWYEDRDMAQAAIHHARLAGDMDRFTRLMIRLMRVRYTTGGAAQVREWMSWLESTGSLARYSEIAAVGSLIHLLEGSALEAERWLDQAAGGTTREGIHPMVQAVSALSARAGMGELVEDAHAARRGLPAGSMWLPAVTLIEGLGHMWGGDPRSADPLFAEAVTLGESTEAFLTVIIALAERAAIAIGVGEWDRAGELVDRSLRRIEENGLEGYPVSALSLTVAARVARHRGDLARADALVTAAARIRPHLNTAIPGLTVQVALEMARAYVELSDIGGARTLIRDAADVVLQRPDLGDLPAQLEDLKNALRGVGPGTIGPAALTRAELRLLPLLATHLTFPEIGERLYISRHTVKTQAMSIYRKLGTSSRSEAVAKALETGMLVQ